MKSPTSFRRIVVSVSVAFATVLAGGLPASADAPVFTSPLVATVDENTTSADILVDVNATDATGFSIIERLKILITSRSTKLPVC